MSWAAAFLAKNRHRLDLGGVGPPSDLVPVLITPRFQTSAHVVHLILDRRSAKPVLVMKAGRRGAAGMEVLVREAANLRAARAAWPGAGSSIPRPIALEEFEGIPFLLETAVEGCVLKPSDVMRQPDRHAGALVRWITEFHTATARPPGSRGGTEHWTDAIERMAREHPLSARDAALISRTHDVTRPLLRSSIPLVFEHGDFSAPNILLSDTGRLGVVDWELASPAGLPGQDLFFALAFVAFARADATNQRQDSAAFASAFLGSSAWAWPLVDEYAESLGLDPSILPSLFVACWSLYVARRAERLRLSDGDATSAGERWVKVKANRYFGLWDQAVTRFGELASRRSSAASMSTCRIELQQLTGEAPCLP
jgi:aminoglycoside phosphotransferase (APT) family kinase protein